MMMGCSNNIYIMYVDNHAHSIPTKIVYEYCQPNQDDSRVGLQLRTNNIGCVYFESHEFQPFSLYVCHCVCACFDLGPVHVKTQIRVLLSTWRSAFPQSVKELNTEQSGGTLSLWLSTLENRAGALTGVCVCVTECVRTLTSMRTWFCVFVYQSLYHDIVHV